MTELFDSPNLLSAYEPAQVEQGLFFLLSSDGFASALWDARVPLLFRRNCVRSMMNLFEGPFARGVTPAVCFVWWELIWLAGIGFEPADCKCKAIADTIVESLDHLLCTGSRECQESALHGLGHADHPMTGHVIQRFLHRHPDLDPALRAYAMRSITRSTAA